MAESHESAEDVSKIRGVAGHIKFQVIKRYRPVLFDFIYAKNACSSLRVC